MRDADDCFDVAQARLEHLVAPDLGHVAQSEQRVVRKDGLDPECPRMHDRLHAECAQGGVRVDDVNRLADEDGPDPRERGEKVGQGRVHVRWRERADGDIVDFYAVGEPPYAGPRRVRVRDDNDLWGRRTHAE